MVRIEILTGPEAGRVVELPPGRHVAGRRPGNALRLAEDSVSGQHLELEVAAAGTVRFRDLGSTNGTWFGGMKVQEGEWFPGSELRLGACRLRLLAEADAPGGTGAAAAGAPAGAEEPEAALHRRAVAEALSERRRSGPLLLVLVLALGLGAGALWWRFGRSGPDREATPGSAMAGGPATGPTLPEDLLEGRGYFAAESGQGWELAQGLEVQDGGLAAGPGAVRVAVLPARIPLPEPGLRLRARATGRVEALVEFGREVEEQPLGRWLAGDLAAGEAALPLPGDATWFRLALRLAGGARVADLEALTLEGPAEERNHETRRLALQGANFLLRHRDGRVLLAAWGTGGSWQTVPGGLRFAAPAGAGRLVLEPGPALLASGPALILAEGGPVPVVPGVEVAGSPGLLLGDEALRLLVRLDEAAILVGTGGSGVGWTGSGLTLSWDLTDAFARAARLARRVEDAARSGDDRGLLEATASLLREVPLDAEVVDRALVLRREAILRGSRELAAIRTDLAEALFLRSSRDLEDVRRRAAALAQRLPGTEIAREAGSLAADVAASLQTARQEETAAMQAYRRRLEAALARDYPLLAAWLRSHLPTGGGEEESDAPGAGEEEQG